LDRQRFFCAYAKFQYKKRGYKDGRGNHGKKAYLYNQAYQQKGQNKNKKGRCAGSVQKNDRNAAEKRLRTTAGSGECAIMSGAELQSISI